MAIALPVIEPARGRLVFSGRPLWSSWVVIRLKDVERFGHLMRLATPGAMAYAAVFPLVQVGLIAESTAFSPGGGYADGAWALLATMCYLPLHLRHVQYAARGSRAPGGAWTLAAMTVVVVAALPLGDFWLPTFHVIAVSALLVLRPRWSLPVVAAVVAAQVPLPLLLDSEVSAAPSYYAFTVLWRSAAVFVPIWMVGAVRRLEEARRALADEAVVRERLRIDAELRETLGAALRSIATRGQQATALVDGDREPLEEELDALVGGARRALAQARQMINGYQHASLSAELDSAAILLTAAGIETRVVLPREGVPDSADEAVRSTLRADIARLLREDTTTGGCIITVTHRAGRVQVDVRSGGPSSGLEQVGAS